MIPDGAMWIHPGIYMHGDELHIDSAEFLGHLGIPVTDAAQNEVANIALRVALEQGIPFAEEHDE